MSDHASSPPKSLDEGSSSESERSDTTVEGPRANLRDVLLDSILEIRGTGTFATSGSFEELILPGISIAGIRDIINLPLSTQDARSVIQASRKAPFGKGSQTLVDETVRRTWEIDGERVSFRNEAWLKWLENVVSFVIKGLGLVGDPKNFRLELHKMLLYEKDAMFKAHKDTEKVPGMCATLVICLPSSHTGGEVVLTHGSKTKTLTTAERSQFDIQYMAWYTDVTHQVMQVQSGYRWILTYNLISTSSVSPQQSATVLDRQAARFRGTLEAWRRHDLTPYFCYVLEHLYTNDSLKQAKMKGPDYYRVANIANCCAEFGEFYVFLARLQKIETVPNDEGGDSSVADEFDLERIAYLDGYVVGQSVGISDELILPQNIYNNRHPDETTGGGYMGNQHADFDQVYNNSALVIVREISVTNFLLGAEHTWRHFKSLLKRLQVYFKAHEDDANNRYLIVQACRNHLTDNHGHESKDLFLGTIAVAAVYIGDKSLFQDAVNQVGQGFSEETFLELGQLVSFLSTTISMSNVEDAFFKITAFCDVLRCLHSFREGFLKTNAVADDTGCLSAWIESVATRALTSLPEAYPEDCGALIKMAELYGSKKLEESIVSFVDRHIKDADFSNALLVEILCWRQTVESTEQLQHFLRLPALETAASQFLIEKFSSASKNPEDRYYPWSSWPSCNEPGERSRRDAGVIKDLYLALRQSGEKMASQLLEQIEQQTKRLPDEELHRLIVPLLEQLIRVTDLDSFGIRHFFQSMMLLYTVRAVGTEPSEPSDWNRLDEFDDCLRTSCSSCLPLKEFLRDPFVMSRIFRSNKDSRHWELRIPRQCKSSRENLDLEGVIVRTVSVTKTLKGWEKRHKEWQERADKTQKAFHQLPQQELKRCLEAKYEEVMHLNEMRTQYGAKHMQEAGEKHSLDQSGLPPEKRLREDASPIG